MASLAVMAGHHSPMDVGNPPAEELRFEIGNTWDADPSC